MKVVHVWSTQIQQQEMPINWTILGDLGLWVLWTSPLCPTILNSYLLSVRWISCSVSFPVIIPFFHDNRPLVLKRSCRYGAFNPADRRIILPWQNTHLVSASVTLGLALTCFPTSRKRNIYARLIKISNSSSDMSRRPCRGQQQNKQFAWARCPFFFFGSASRLFWFIVHASSHMLEVCRGYRVQGWARSLAPDPIGWSQIPGSTFHHNADTCQRLHRV